LCALCCLAQHILLYTKLHFCAIEATEPALSTTMKREEAVSSGMRSSIAFSTVHPLSSIILISLASCSGPHNTSHHLSSNNPLSRAASPSHCYSPSTALHFVPSHPPSIQRTGRYQPCIYEVRYGTVSPHLITSRKHAPSRSRASPSGAINKASPSAMSPP
jgi:hypothetical protein